MISFQRRLKNLNKKAFVIYIKAKDVLEIDKISKMFGHPSKC